MTMRAISAHKTDVGLVRDHNEDYVWVNREANIYILADGVGGYLAGEIASQMASEQVGQIMTTHLEKKPTELTSQTAKIWLTNAIETANKSIYQTAQANKGQKEMSTTLVAMVLQLPHVYICHAGDSRAYQFHASTITQLTNDDVWDMGTRFPHILTKAVGQEQPLNPQFIETKVVSDDWLLLCSDGLWSLVGDNQLELIMQTHLKDTPQQCTAHLVKAANKAGGTDNISVVAIKIVAADNAV